MNLNLTIPIDAVDSKLQQSDGQTHGAVFDFFGSWCAHVHHGNLTKCTFR